MKDISSPMEYLGGQLATPVVNISIAYEAAKIIEALDFMEVRVVENRNKLNPLEFLAVDLIAKMAGHNCFEDVMSEYLRHNCFEDVMPEYLRYILKVINGYDE